MNNLKLLQGRNVVHLVGLGRVARKYEPWCAVVRTLQHVKAPLPNSPQMHSKLIYRNVIDPLCSRISSIFNWYPCLVFWAWLYPQQGLLNNNLLSLHGLVTCHLPIWTFQSMTKSTKLFLTIKYVAMGAQTHHIQARFDQISDILTDEYVMYSACLSCIDLPIVRRVIKNRFYVFEQAISRFSSRAIPPATESLCRIWNTKTSLHRKTWKMQSSRSQWPPHMLLQAKFSKIFPLNSVGVGS